MYTMSGPPIRLIQSIFDGPDDALYTKIITYTINIAASDLSSAFDHADPIGISPGYSTTGKLISLAIADDKICRIIEFTQPKSNNKCTDEKRSPTLQEEVFMGQQILQDQILCRTAGDIFAFDMGPLAASLYCDLEGLRITNAVDISTVDRKPLTAIETALGNSVKIKVCNLTDVFSNPFYDFEDKNHTTDLAQRAWLSQFLARSGNGAGMFDKVPRIDTRNFDPIYLDMIAKVANDALRLDYKKPLQINHQFSQSFDHKKNQVLLESSNFKNKLRSRQSVQVEVSQAGQRGKFSTPGVMGTVTGKSGNLITNLDLAEGKVIAKITSNGRDDPTPAEAQRAATVLRILQGSEKLDENPWIQNIWFPLDDDGLLAWPNEWPEQSQSPSRSTIQQPAPASTQLQSRLNPSQQNAVNGMVASEDNHRIMLIQGPPGTGKTSVIAAFIHYALRFNKGGIWLVAQSNVAVKNIAEKLMSIGFKDWRLLVSKDFHLGWHEHLYHKVKKNVIRSDTFNMVPSQDNLEDCQVILCTLDMLSKSNIDKFTKKIPLKTMVVDEASQIEVGNYLSIFINFKHSLHKLCFIGDNKQLPPFGQEHLQDLQCYELFIFLSTCCLILFFFASCLRFLQHVQHMVGFFSHTRCNLVYPMLLISLEHSIS